MFNKIKSFFLKKNDHVEEIPSYEEKRKIIDFYRKQTESYCFIETGTFLGDTVDFFKDKFQSTFSIELSEELAERAAKRFESIPNVKIIQGDSGNVLETLVPKISQPSIFWLDGHYSSEFFYNGEFIKTAKADKNTPVEKELDLILRSQQLHIVLIDDARLFTGENDYPTIEKVQRKVLALNTDYSVKVFRDIIHIIPNKCTFYK